MLVDKGGVEESMSPVEGEVFERDSAEGKEYEFEACKKLLRRQVTRVSFSACERDGAVDHDYSDAHSVDQLM